MKYVVKRCVAALQPLLRLAPAVIVSVAISGCGSAVPTPENSAWASVSGAFSGSGTDPTKDAKLNPSSWYMKVLAPDSPPAVLGFGYLETQTTPPTEVWYSGSGQVIKIQAGRIVATHGLPGVQWAGVKPEQKWPEWVSVAQSKGVFTRVRASVPTYDYGIRETVQVVAGKAPSASMDVLMPGASNEKAANWRWYRESVLNTNRAKLPDSVYATAYIGGVAVVVYSEQCLSETYCLKLVRWPQLSSEVHPW